MSIFKRKKEDNRRKYSRINHRNLVAVDVQGERHIFNLIDISETGLQFSSSHEFKKKEILSLKVNLAESDIQLEMLSRVAWTRTLIYKKVKVYRIGVSFVELSQEARQVIRHLVLPIAKAA